MTTINILFPNFVLNRTSNIRDRRSSGLPKRLYCTQPLTVAVTTAEPIVRRSANYPPTLWPSKFLQSLTNKYTGQEYEIRSHTLKEAVRKMISEDCKVENLLSALELVDDLQRLGISYHFEDEISSVLKMMYYNYFKTQDKWNKLDMKLKALGFRILREHGYPIPKDIFNNLKDEAGNFKACICEDIGGMLNLYEASFLVVDDESILDEAKDFTSKYLEKVLEENKIMDETMSMLISHSLQLPLRWRTQRSEAVWFIEVYERRSSVNPVLVELAKLDFNMVQAIHQEDLKYSSRWWAALGWDKKLRFARDRLVDSFEWAVVSSYKPQFQVLRTTITKVISLVNTIDDIYDVYGTLDELEQFTDIAERWDINAIEELPEYMKICFLGFYNTINETAYSQLTNEGFHVLPHLKKAWAKYFKANLIEAQWYANGYTPTLEEYLNNSCITISAPVILTHAYFITGNEITKEGLQYLEKCENVVHCSSMILRLADDLGTSSDELKRGDNPKSLQCYMHETGASEDEARAYIKNLIWETWKKLNKERANIRSPFSQAFIECATNLGRMAQFTYQFGDGFGSPDVLTKSHALSLLFNPKS